MVDNKRNTHRVRGEYGFRSLSKIKRLKFASSFTSPEKEKYFLFIYEVITWEKRKKALLSSSANMLNWATLLPLLPLRCYHSCRQCWATSERVPSGGVTLKRRCTYRPSVIYLIVNKLLSLSLSTPEMVADFMTKQTQRLTHEHHLPTRVRKPARPHTFRTHSARTCITCLLLSRCLCLSFLLFIDLFIRGGVIQICRISSPIYSGTRKYSHVIFPPPQSLHSSSAVKFSIPSIHGYTNH